MDNSPADQCVFMNGQPWEDEVIGRGWLVLTPSLLIDGIYRQVFPNHCTAQLLARAYD
jgi:hypothetical protein